MTERLMRQAPCHRVTRDALNAAASTPGTSADNAALDPGPPRLQPLPDGDQAALIETTERRQIRGREGSVEHVEVSLMGS